MGLIDWKDVIAWVLLPNLNHGGRFLSCPAKVAWFGPAVGAQHRPKGPQGPTTEVLIGRCTPVFHFSKVQRVLLLAALLGLAILLFVYLHGRLEIDACLDSGGQWDYEAGKCES